jgi:putative transposase
MTSISSPGTTSFRKQKMRVAVRRIDGNPALAGILREPEYGPDHSVRRVRQNGEIKWNGTTIFINQALVGEPVGLTEDTARWIVSYGPIVLGTIAHRDDRLRRPKRKKGCGLEDNAARCPQGPQPQQQQA